MSDTQPTTADLDPAFRSGAFDPLVPADLLHDEVAQRRETGFDVDDVVAAANAVGPDDQTTLLELVDAMADLPDPPGWDHDEPDDLRLILAGLDQPTSAVGAGAQASDYADRVHAAWLGRIAGCNLGKPVEQGDHWTVEHIRAYLELADAYPLADYFPKLSPMPAGYEFRDNWPETTRGNVDGSARDDDVDYPILALHLLEQHGRGLRPEHVGHAWTTLLPLRQVYTAERAAYVNLTKGLPLSQVPRFRNPYREWIGAQIRADVFGYVLPGDPQAAAELAFRDASLSHVGNGVYGEMWAAALVSAAFVSADATEAISTALTVVPPRSRLHAAVTHVLGMRAAGVGYDAAVAAIRQAYGHYAWIHTVNNAALVAVGLLWGDGDYTAAVGRTVMGGWDTDSNGATVGSVAGILAGTAGLPERMIAPLHDRTRSALFGFDHSVISDLADRTVRLGGTFAS